MDTIEQEAVDAFSRDGAIICRNVFPAELIEECNAAIDSFSDFKIPLRDRNLVFDADGDERYIKYFQHVNLYVGSFWKLMNVRALRIGEELLGEFVYFYGIGLHDKAPGAGSVTPPHQDNFYWCRSPAQALTAYIPLQAQNAENGCLVYRLGSHLDGVLDHEPSTTRAFSSYIHDLDEESLGAAASGSSAR